MLIVFSFKMRSLRKVIQLLIYVFAPKETLICFYMIMVWLQRDLSLVLKKLKVSVFMGMDIEKLPH